MGTCSNTVKFVLAWLLTFLVADLSICEASDKVLCIPSERQALLSFKQHLLDPSNRLASWYEENMDCCNWIFVVCSNETGHILQLHLTTSPPSSLYFSYFEDEAYERSRFGGEIHPSILDLKHLRYLDLSGNDFDSLEIPSFIGLMKSLTYLNLSHAQLTGSIPHQIGNLSNLLYLDLAGNSYTGSIPYQIGNLSNLLYLDICGAYNMNGISLSVENLQWLSSLSSLQFLQLSHVNLSNAFDWLHVVQSFPSLLELHLTRSVLHHHFPPITTNFSHLAVLDLSHSCDFGMSSIPNWIFQIKSLVSLHLSDNNLQGFIPSGIQNLTLIQDLDLSQNLFNSSIPDWLYGLNHLKFLSLSHNNLHGAISNAIGNLTSIVTLDLAYSHLEGPIPGSLGNLCNLRSAYFTNMKCNQQVSEILGIMSRCVSDRLEHLSLSGTNLYGQLTNQIGAFENLIELGLSDNAIHGALPKFLGNLTSLTYLHLSGNQFSGNPFDVIQSLFKLQILSISDNLFQGIVNEDHLTNFTKLIAFSASRNQLILKVSSSWSPSFQHVAYLYMSSWNIGPDFPSWIQSLKYLHYLDISSNAIFDSIQGELPSTMNKLISVTSIDLSSNHLSGLLPCISHKVVHLDLSSNWFSGSITAFLCEKQEEPMSLVYLNLASNNLIGEIPNCWMMWPNLADVRLGNNHFSGSLPTSLGSLPWLNSLQLRNNTLSGNFPICLKSSTKLMFLDLGGNQFSGIIPSWVGHILLNLKVFLLRSNKFVGSIPTHTCSLNSLQILDLAQNNLTGHIPRCINQLSAMLVKNSTFQSYISYQVNPTKLPISDVLLNLKGRDDEYKYLGLITSIDLSDNKLYGEIPRELTSLIGLHFLNLSKNLLCGQIPKNIGNMRLLLSMDFSRNQLSGEIPQSMSNLNFLSMLNLSYNNLKGKIPTGTQLQSFEASSFIGNDLWGPPLTNYPLDNAIPDNNHNGKETGGDGINWFYVSMPFGFVFGFWVVIGPLLYHRSWRYTYFQFLDSLWYKLQCSWC